MLKTSVPPFNSAPAATLHLWLQVRPIVYSLTPHYNTLPHQDLQILVFVGFFRKLPKTEKNGKNTETWKPIMVSVKTFPKSV